MNLQKPLNIWLLRDGETLPVVKDAKKMRTWRLSEALADRGHSVTWWSSNFFHAKKEKICEGNKTLKLRDNLTVRFLDCGTYKKNVSFQRIKHHFILGKKFAALAKEEEKPDIIISSLPTLDFPREAIKYGKAHNIPVIIDVRDMWPDIFISYVPLFLRPFIRLPIFLYNKKIKYCLKKAQGIVSMSEDLLGWALKKANLKKDNNKVFYLGYDESSAHEKELIQELAEVKKDNFVFSYLGSFVKSYEVDLIIEAAKILEKDTNFKGYFVLAGEGDLWKTLKQKAEGLKKVIVLGWLDKKKSAYLMDITDVSLIPNKTTAFPNKVFEALYFGKPMIFCMNGEAKDVLEKYKAGIYYEKGNINSFINGIKEILKSNKLEIMKQNSHDLYHTHFTAHKIYSEYCDYIEKIHSNYKK
ncbi:MAG: glycosyltransferase family 4 protein [Bacteroidota bacterium]|nr:glycosyltransferase family 4 protein [Bacteroidota bacterium]